MSTPWLLFVGIGLGTFLLRGSMLWLFASLDVPDGLERALQFVPAAVLAALVAPALLVHDGAVDWSVTNVHLLSGVVAVLVAWTTESVLATLVAGMAAFWTLHAIVG